MNSVSKEKFLKKLKINPSRRSFLKTTAIGSSAVALSTLVGIKTSKDAKAFAYEPYPRDDDLETVVTSCAHNCGSRHVLVAHKKGEVIVRLSTDDGTLEGENYGYDTEQVAQLRGCLRGRSYRSRIYSPERLLYPMMRVGARGEGRFKRVSWEEALTFVAQKMLYLKQMYGPTAILDQSYAGASWGVLHKSDQVSGLLGRFLGLFGCRTNSWSVPSYQGTTFSSDMTFGTHKDGNEDDAFAHSKLIIMWGWNPAYTFHGGNTFYYMRMAKQRGCKFILVDPQYTDSASAYDADWIPIRPNTDAAMMAGMIYHIFKNNWQDQDFINNFCLGVDKGTMPPQFANHENFRDYIFGIYDNQPKTPEWAAEICGVSAKTIKNLAKLYATTKPAALKASWAPGRNAFGEQYSRMAAALQAVTGNIGKLGGSSEGVGKAWDAVAVGYPEDEYSNVFFASIKSDRWAHCVLNFPNVSREEVGLWPKTDMWNGVIPNIKGIFWQGSDWFNQLTNVNKEIAAIQKLELVVCMDSTITPSGIWADVLLPVSTHFERRDVGLPWYKGHYYINRPRVIKPMGESKTDFQIFTELSRRLNPGSERIFNPLADHDYFYNDDKAMLIDELYLRNWWQKVQMQQGVQMSFEEFNKRGIYKFKFKKPKVAFQDNIEKGKPWRTPSGKIEIFSTKLASVNDFRFTQWGYHIPAIPKWIQPEESLNNKEFSKVYPFHMVTPHPRHRTHSIFNNIPWLRETYEQEITINSVDAKKLGIKTGDNVRVFNDRGSMVLPAYVTERVMPNVVVVYEGAWMDIDANGVDRSGNPNFLTVDEPSPAGAFAYNTILCNIEKSNLNHRPGWDKLATSRSHIYRRDS